MIFSVILWFLIVTTIASGHECERPCTQGDVRTCMYEFHLQEYHTLGRACYSCPQELSDCARPECIAADGVSRPLLAVNRQLPGPAIQVCEGDRIVVDVYNGQLSDTETIHWHGQHMRDHQYYDGVPFVTQCPILGAFRYDFIAANPGTTFWHSHSGLHRAEGVFGALVVRQAEDVQAETYDVDAFENVLVLQDWLHTTAFDKFMGRHQSTLDDYATTLLINGKGRNTAAEIEGLEVFAVPRETVAVTPGLKYRLRLINAAALNCPVIVSVDRHPMTVIATDSHNNIPITVESLVIYSGERFDIVIEANQPIGNYWIRFNGLVDCEQNFCHQGAILRYEGAAIEEPKEPLEYSSEYPPGTVLNPLNSVDGENELTLVDVDSFAPNSLPANVDKQFYLGFDFNRINNTLLYNSEFYPYDQVSEEWKINTPQMNDISFIFPDSPPLSQPEAPMPNLCKYGETPSCEGDYCSCTYVLEVALGETVEFVLVDQGNIGDENHPFHLHGYSFGVVAMGKLGRFVWD
ncbi:Mco1p [Halocaridina rubra]|uniref:Mco1p n=1 Tax=Halocaridina rubra TaxID=373956 RepID=A0AAN8XI84_HALRR